MLPACSTRSLIGCSRYIPQSNAHPRLTSRAQHGTALGRPGWWRHLDSDWTGTWLQIATQARGHSAQALTTITKAAITGAIQHARPSFRTQWYQQIVVLAPLGCHNAGQASPDGLLDQHAENHHPSCLPDRLTW